MLPLEEVLTSHGRIYNATASFYKNNKLKNPPYEALGGDYLNYKDFFKSTPLVHVSICLLICKTS